MGSGIMSGIDSSAVASAAAAMMQSLMNDPNNMNSFQSDSYNSDTSSNLGREDEYDLDSSSARSNSPGQLMTNIDE